MDIFHDIARRLSSEERATVLRFREAARRHEALPAEINDLPVGFLACVGVDDDLRVLHVLSPFGMRVATAAEALAEEDAA